MSCMRLGAETETQNVSVHQLRSMPQLVSVVERLAVIKRVQMPRYSLRSSSGGGGGAAP